MREIIIPSEDYHIEENEATKAPVYKQQDRNAGRIRCNKDDRSFLTKHVKATYVKTSEA